MVQHRVYVGKPMMGKKNRKRKFGNEFVGAQAAYEKRAPKVEKRAPKVQTCADDRSCGKIAEVPPSPCKSEKDDMRAKDEEDRPDWVECEQSQQVDMRAKDEEDGPDWGDASDADNV